MVYAGFWQRAGAALIDIVITTVAGVALMFAVGLFLIAGGVADPTVLEAAGNVGGIVLAWIYFAAMESSYRQATVGKMVLGLTVAGVDGRRIGFGRATARHFAKILSTLLLLIGFIMVAFTPRRQGLHDMLADCLVLRRSARPGPPGA